MGVDEQAKKENVKKKKGESLSTMTVLSERGSETTEQRKAMPRSNGTQTMGTDRRTGWCDEAVTLY